MGWIIRDQSSLALRPRMFWVNKFIWSSSISEDNRINVRNWGWIVSETIVDQTRTCRGDSGQCDGKLSDYILI